MANLGFSATLSVNDTSAGTVFTTIPEITEFNVPGREGGSEETTTLYQSTTGRLFIPHRLVDPGTIKFKALYTPLLWVRLNGLLLVDLQAAAVKTAWKVTCPDSDGIGAVVAQVFQISGFLTKLSEMQLNRDGVQMIEGEIKLSGEWTITGGV